MFSHPIFPLFFVNPKMPESLLRGKKCKSILWIQVSFCDVFLTDSKQRRFYNSFICFFLMFIYSYPFLLENLILMLFPVPIQCWFQRVARGEMTPLPRKCDYMLINSLEVQFPIGTPECKNPSRRKMFKFTTVPIRFKSIAKWFVCLQIYVWVGRTTL